MLKSNYININETHIFLNTYARYLWHEQNYQKSDIINCLNDYMVNHYANYNKNDWIQSIEKYSTNASKYPLCKCEGIPVSKKEITIIENINNKVLERLAFTLLCIAKFKNFKNEKNNSWVSCSNSEIFSMACINASLVDRDLKINQLMELGLIEYAKRINNLNIRVTFVEKQMSENNSSKLVISDFRKLGYEWRKYHGENYIRCSKCGILVKNTNGKRKYCSNCAKDVNRELARLKKATTIPPALDGG